MASNEGGGGGRTPNDAAIEAADSGTMKSGVSSPAALSHSARVVSSGSNQQGGNHQKMQSIRTPHDNDVLCGRGGGTNHHPGNRRYRKWVEDRKVDYVNSSKRDKPQVSRGIVEAVRAQDPPGRFLQKDEQTGLWSDIGDQKAREKTAQALREGAPGIRKEIGQPYVHPIVPGEARISLAQPSKQDLTVGHHSPPQMAMSDPTAEDGDMSDGIDSSRGLMKLAPAVSATALKRPQSLGSGGGSKRVVSAPVTTGHTSSSAGNGGGKLPLRAQTGYYGSSGRGGKRGVSVPSQMQYEGSTGYHPHHGQPYHGYPPHSQYAPHYPQPQLQQPFPVAAAQWVAGGTTAAPTTGPSSTFGTRSTSSAATIAGTSGVTVSDDVARRLLLSEWITGGKADGHQLELQRKMEAEADAYRTAGLMGIDPEEIAKRLEGGKEDIASIVESYRGKASDIAAAKPATGISEPPCAQKRRKFNTEDGARQEKTEARKRIHEALKSMGL